MHQDKAEQIVHSANNQVLTLPSLEGPVTGSTKKKQQEAVGYVCFCFYQMNMENNYCTIVHQ